VAASAALGKPAPEIVRWFGRNALGLLEKNYPHFFRPHSSTLPFLLTLNDVIHPEVRRIYPGADVPVFQFDTTAQHVLLMGYRSGRRLRAFAEGLIEGAAAPFGEEVRIEQSRCMNRGDDRCLFQISFAPRS